MSDGDRLRQSWHTALTNAEAHFRKLLASSSSPDWKRINATSNTGGNAKVGRAVGSANPVVVHRKATKGGDDIYRVVMDVPTGEDHVSLEPWKAVLETPELRTEWDPAVEEAHLIEFVDRVGRIVKTNFTLGWPANPRDAVTISKSFHDHQTVIEISTSVPRSPDEPSYLRPSPPYVRSNVSLFAWCIQHIPQPPTSPPTSPGPSSPSKPARRNTLGGRLRITCFSQHDLRAAWTLGTSYSAIAQQMSTMVLGLLKTVNKRGSRVPKLIGFGNGVSIEKIRFQVDREAFTVDYAIVPEEEEHASANGVSTQGMEELYVIREQRRLTRSVECILPSSEGWDVQISTKAPTKELEQLPWTANATRSYSQSSSASPSKESDQILLRLSHAALPDEHSVLKVHLVIELSPPSSGLRLNGVSQPILEIEDRDPISYYQPGNSIIQDIGSVADISFNGVSGSSAVSINSTVGSVGSIAEIPPQLVRKLTERSQAGEKSVLSRVRRNYIYFSSLLQEPEAKWKRTTESRGVSITQLDSIDPTLVVYRAEATFVGVGLWDLYGALVSPGAKIYWDKQHEDAVLLEDVNELTELWHFKTKPAWPVNGRDSVVLKTVYKSPTTIHVFSFSVDDTHIFPNIPPVDQNVIRTQVDLQGWAIEALSPTTTSLTLLEQSDPKGWTNKTSIPQQMINHLAGIGEFAIKCGGPPFLTRLSGAKVNQMRYDHDRGSFRVEYEGSASRRPPTSNDEDSISGLSSSGVPMIECEIRCDIDTWAPSLDIVVDPPPQSITCLRRHRLSQEGGGLWVTLNHDSLVNDDERLLVIVRRSPVGIKEKGLVMVNGAKVQVDVEELPESEIKTLSKQKRVKPPRVPLDQPPVVGVIRRRRAEWEDADAEQNKGSTLSGDASPTTSAFRSWASAPRFSSPLSKLWSTSSQQPPTSTLPVGVPSPLSGAHAVLSSSTLPMQYALDTLGWLQDSHSHGISAGWTLVNDKGLSVYRKLIPEVSPVVPVHKAEKVVEGVSAEEIAAVVKNYSCRKKWDDWFDSAQTLETYGAESQLSFVISKAGFPFRDRGFYVASATARAQGPPNLQHRRSGETEQAGGSRTVIYCASTSFSHDSVARFSPSKYNSYALPIGRVYVDAWILETLDPYTTENYAIPSTRCTRLIAVDYAGSIPAAVNAMINATLAKSILAVDTYVKSISPLPIARMPAAGLMIIEKKVVEGDLTIAEKSWKSRKRDDTRTLIASRFSPDDCSYRATILVTLSSPPRSPNSVSESTTPRPSRLLLNSPPLSPLSSISPEGSEPTEKECTIVTPTQSRISSSTPSTLASRSRSISTSGSRLRASSSVFTVRGEVKPATDLLVAEIILDSKLYTDGYVVNLSSRISAPMRNIPLQFAGDLDDTKVFPIVTTIHTVPSSPLHSSGLSTGPPTRHLLRFTLPTAQYQISTVEDPLTGELQSAPPKPRWLSDLEEKGAILEVDVKPTTAKPRKSGIVVVNGQEIKVFAEKDSLTSLGRDELLDDRINKLTIISRTPGDGEVIPDDFKVPVAIADNLLDISAAKASLISKQDSTKPQTPEDEDTEKASLTIVTIDPPPPEPVPVSATGLLGFLSSYQNPLARFKSPRNSVNSSTFTSPIKSTIQLPGSFDTGTPIIVRNHSSRHSYSLSTVIIVALLAFLIGSLLRSLLSPADFIYLVSDAHDVGDFDENLGWREIKRLLEIKTFGGWDFQIALVR